MVLGIKWLYLLNNIAWKFKRRKMGQVTRTIRGEHPRNTPSKNIQTASEIKNTVHLYFVHVFSTNSDLN